MARCPGINMYLYGIQTLHNSSNKKNLCLPKHLEVYLRILFVSYHKCTVNVFSAFSVFPQYLLYYCTKTPLGNGKPLHICVSILYTVFAVLSGLGIRSSVFRANRLFFAQK